MYSHRNFVAIMYIQAEIYVFHIHFRLQATIFDFSLTPTDSSV